MRRIFLWAARNAWLRDHLPRMRFMRRAVRRFMPGETMESALDAAAPLQAAGIGTMYTKLGENLESLAEADAVADHYIAVLDAIQARGLAGEISVKPTQLGLDIDEDRALAHLTRLAAHAATTGSYVWIDMEGSAYTDATLRLYERVRAVQPRTGICLQAYLRRTAADIERLRPLDPAIRLVKGAYDEPAEVAHQAKRDVDLAYARQLETLMAANAYPMVATHDPELIDLTRRLAAHGRRDRASFEFQMLYGVRRDLQRQLADEGWRVRVYVPYGTQWYSYFMRRLAERPANLAFFLGSLVRR
jgi:proline dehydrogenase